MMFLEDGSLVTGINASLIVWNTDQTSSVTLEGHTKQVSSLCCIDSYYFASASLDERIIIWSNNCAYFFKEMMIPCMHGPILSLISIDALTLASASSDGTIDIWMWNQGTCKYTFRGHTDKVNCLRIFSNNLIASGSSDHTVRLWSIDEPDTPEALVLIGHLESVNCIEVVDSNVLVSGSDDQTIRIWTIDCREHSGTVIIRTHTIPIDSPVLCLTKLIGHCFISASEDGSIRVWDLHRTRCLRTLRSHKREVKAVVQIGCGNIISASQSILHWNPFGDF